MPTYEYDCKSCGGRVEFFQSITAAPKRKCPHCGAPRGLQRRIGAGAGLIFRGNGFYITDYRSESYKKAAKGEADGSGGSKDAKASEGGAKASEGSSAGTQAPPKGEGGAAPKEKAAAS